jgi:hypothetical protein
VCADSDKIYFAILETDSLPCDILVNLEDLLDALKPDDWRTANPFSVDIQEAQALLFDPYASRANQADVLSEWLRRGQPCLFGRIAAKSQITYCILTEADVLKGDDHVRDLIHQSRLVWRRNALLGKQHAFVILLVSPTIARVRPCVGLRDIALRLCQIYLSDDSISTDKIFLDSLSLEINRPEFHEYRTWQAGVNFFGSSGDRTWWHDHRIPGGLAFSMNSVGHMTRARLESELPKRPALRLVEPADRLVDFALLFAMRTIHTASKGVQPGTRLADRDGHCPISEGVRGKSLYEMASYNERYYLGQYHTDITVPSEYFDPSIIRPLKDECKLDFTYLHDQSAPEYALMAVGEDALRAEVLAALGWDT